MGLAAPRKKTKISNDPNNTNWARSTSGFGHKILSAQGWTPGSFLGAHNAAHADMFTAASASHIRVSLKDDTLGLGARPKRDLLDEPTGLDAFRGLLGRLNGKSDSDIAADQRKVDDAKVARYISTRWQTIQFISGGLLAQEKEDAQEKENCLSARESRDRQGNPTSLDIEDIDSEQGPLKQAEKTSKKGDKERKKEKKEKKEKNEKKEKKDKKENKENKENKEKKEKKEKKRKRKEQDQDTDSVSHGEDAPESDSQTATSDGRETPLRAAMPSRERRPLGKHMLRGRYIAQKKKALLDDKSLNEIFMIKS